MLKNPSHKALEHGPMNCRTKRSEHKHMYFRTIIKKKKKKPKSQNQHLQQNIEKTEHFSSYMIPWFLNFAFRNPRTFCSTDSYSKLKGKTKMELFQLVGVGGGHRDTVGRPSDPAPSEKHLCKPSPQATDTQSRDPIS